YRFAHALIRNVAYDLMLFEQRRALHREIGLRLESPAFAELGPGPALLFRHWSAAGDDERTLRYADLAATEAMQLGAYREATAFLAWRALRRRLPPRPRPAATEEARALELELARAHRQLSVVAYFAGDRVEIVRHAARALFHAERAEPSADLAGALAEIGACFG